MTKDANFLPEELLALLQQASEQSQDNIQIEKITHVFKLMSNAKIPYKDNEFIYQQITEGNSYTKSNVDRILYAFELFENEKIPFKVNRDLCLAIIFGGSYIDNLKSMIDFMMNRGIRYQENPGFWHRIILIGLNNFDNLTLIFDALENAKIPYKGNESFYQTAADCFYHHGNADNLNNAFAALARAKISFVGNKNLYRSIVKHGDNNANVSKILDKLDEMKIPTHMLDVYNVFANPNILVNNSEYVIHALNSLAEAGYTYSSHTKLYATLLKLFSTEPAGYLNTATNIVKQACELIKLPQNNTAQREALDAIIEKNLAWFSHLIQGPINQSESTKKLMTVLNDISKIDVNKDINKQVYVRFTPPETYLLTLPNGDEINLSLLIRNANLSQIKLNDSLIERLNPIFDKIYDQWVFSGDGNPHPIFDKFPKIQKQAILNYNGGSYININKLFRLEPLENTSFSFNSDPSKDALAYFLAGCLINDGLNKMPIIVDQTPQKIILDKIASASQVNIRDYINDEIGYKALLKKSFNEKKINKRQHDELIDFYKLLDVCYTHTGLLDRGEMISPETIQKRIRPKSTKFPALRSFSRRKGGAFEFHGDDTTRSILEGVPSLYSIGNEAQQEVILPQSSQAIITQGQDSLIWTFVRSPELESPDHYWSELALQYAFDHHLSKKYPEHPNSLTLDDSVIERPKYGLAYTYRVMSYIEQVINYSAKYAEDEEFKTFCHKISSQDIEWLRIAAAFSTTGLKNEAGSVDQEASMANFSQFVNQTRGLQNQVKKIDHMKAIIRHVGSSSIDQNKFFTSDNLGYKSCQFYKRILDMSLKLDEVGNSANHLKKVEAELNALTQKSRSQQRALNHLLQYVIDVNKSQGNSINCDITSRGEVVAVQIPYTDAFAKASSSIKELNALTNMAVCPSFEDKKFRKT